MSNPPTHSSMSFGASSSKKAKLDSAEHVVDGSKPVQWQRRRVWRACESCRRKKIKCDGREPTCSQCAVGGNQCTWIQTKDRAALSRHYVQELEARLLHMESLLKQVAPVVEILGHPSESIAVPSFSHPSTASNTPPKCDSDATLTHDDGRPPGDLDDSGGVTAAATRDEEETSHVTDQFGQLALDEKGHLRWIGGSSTMSLIEAFRNATSSPPDQYSPPPEHPHAPNPTVNMLYFPSGVAFGKLRALPGEEEVEYPERDLADQLVEAYFNRFHFVLPVLDKPSFMEKYKRLMDANGRGAEAGFVSVVFAVFACAARFVDDPRLKGEDSGRPSGMIFYERAMILHYIGHTNTQLAHVQCFVLLSSFLASLNSLPQAWLLVGQAVRTAQDLGLHRSPRHLILTSIDKETRRKVWWCVYGLDRMLAVALGRPLGIEDGDCDAELPIDLDDEDLPAYFAGASVDRSSPTLMQGFIALTALYKIAGKVLRSVYAIDKCKEALETGKASELQATVDRLDAQLTKWCDDLPAPFKSSPTNSKQVSMGAILCTSYYAVLITLHRNFLPTRRKQAPSPGSTSVPKAVCASRSCIFLAPSIKDVIPPSHHLAFFIQFLFSSAVIILLVVMHATDEAAAKTAMEEVDGCVHALEALEGSWPGARKCKELLTELTNATRESMKTHGNKNQNLANAFDATKQPGTLQTSPSAPAPVQAELPKQRKKSKSGSPPNRTKPTPSLNTAVPPASSHPSASSYQFQPTLFTGSPTTASHKRPRDEGNDGDTHMTFRHSFSGSFPSHDASTSPPSTTLAMHERRGSVEQTPSPQMSGDFTGAQYAYNQPAPLPYNAPPHWATPRANSADLKLDADPNALFPLASHYQPTPSMDSGFLPYVGSTFESAPSMASPTAASFDLSGLPPFAGLDFIHNFTSSGYSNGGDSASMEALWQSLGAGAFRGGPESSFALVDGGITETQT